MCVQPMPSRWVSSSMCGDWVAGLGVPGMMVLFGPVVVRLRVSRVSRRRNFWRSVGVGVVSMEDSLVASLFGVASEIWPEAMSMGLLIDCDASVGSFSRADGVLGSPSKLSRFRLIPDAGELLGGDCAINSGRK